MNSSQHTMEGLSPPLDSYQTPLSIGLSHAVAVSATLGMLFHVTILRIVEVEGFVYRLITLGLITVASFCVAHVHVGLSPAAAIVRVALLFSSFSGALFLSIIIYRVLFHRLRRFPGPFPAKITRFYNAYKASRNLQYFNQVREWNREYGDFVRTGPRELAILRKSAIPLIYGPESKCRKSTFYNQVDTDPMKASVQTTRDYNQHRKRRRTWDRGFTSKALDMYEPLIDAKTDEFVAQLSRLETVDATAWSMYLLFDIMGKVGFGKDFYGVTKGVEDPAIKALHQSMSTVAVLGHVPWLLNMLAKIPGAAAAYSEFLAWCGSELEEKRKRWNPEEYPRDIVSWLIKATADKEPSASPSDMALHEDSRLVIVAGSDTTATTLACILHYLARHPAVQQKLQSQVDSVLGGEWSYEKVKTITYIDDIINETLRLKPALLTGVYRVTPPQGITVDETFIPGDINVFVPTQGIQTDPRYWKEATAFVPERFGERRAEMGTDGAPFMPFTLGVHQCPGKSLAFLSLRITLSKVMQEFDVAFAPGETGETFDKETKDTFTTQLPPVMIRFTKRSGGREG